MFFKMMKLELDQIDSILMHNSLVTMIMHNIFGYSVSCVILNQNIIF